MHRFSAKGHEIKKDITILFSIFSFSGDNAVAIVIVAFGEIALRQRRGKHR